MPIAEQLAEARAAYHKLMLGEKLVTVRYADRTVSYNQTSVDKLRAYIAELEMKLNGRRPPFEVEFS